MRCGQKTVKMDFLAKKSNHNKQNKKKTKVEVTFIKLKPCEAMLRRVLYDVKI